MKRPPRAPFPGLAGLAAGVHPLPRPALHHLSTVLRLRAGAPVLLFDPDAGHEAAGVLEDDAGLVRFEAPRAPARAAHDVVWLHGLPKAKKADAIVQDATELGATHVVLFRAARSVVALDGERAEKRTARLQAVADDAARQSGRARAPEVRVEADLDAALATLPADAAVFVLAPGAERSLGEALLDALAAPASALVFVAGPEGGLDDDEIARAAAARPGARAVVLGATVLRTETVPAAVLGALRALEPVARSALPRGPRPQ